MEQQFTMHRSVGAGMHNCKYSVKPRIITQFSRNVVMQGE